MTNKLRNLLEIAKFVLPPIGALLDDDDGERLAKDVADVVEAIVGHLAPKDQKKTVENDPVLQAELKIKIEEAANRRAEEDNRARETELNEALDAQRQELSREQQQHEQELEEFQKNLEDIETARIYAAKSATSERVWVSGINPLLSLIIVFAFFYLLYLIAVNPIGGEILVNANGEVLAEADVTRNDSGALVDADGKPVVSQPANKKLEVFYVAFGALATAFVTVVGFHFGSSYGSKRKTSLQRLYGTRGLLSSGGSSPSPSGNGSATAADSATLLRKGRAVPLSSDQHISTVDVGGADMHPFERFWLENLSHINHFSWRELLEKGAGNTGVGLNTDPPRELYRNVIPLVNALERIRKELGAPVQLISVYRSPAYNRHVGGATSSRHMQFDAADFRVLGDGAGSPGQWSKTVKRLRNTGLFKGGIGIYPSFIHLDTRGKNADWDGR